MTREELIEVMARAILRDHEDGANMDTHAVPERAASRHAIAALSALEAAGVRLVSFDALAELVGAAAFALGSLENNITGSPAAIASLKKAIDSIVSAQKDTKE